MVIYANGTKDSFEEYTPPIIYYIKPVDLTITSNGWRYYYKDHLIRERDMLEIAQDLDVKKINLAIKKTENISDRKIQKKIHKNTFGNVY